MSTYKVRVNVTISEATEITGVRLAPQTYLSYQSDWDIEGETLTDIAPQIDHVIATMKAVGARGPL